MRSMILKQDSGTSSLKDTAKFGVIELDSIPVVDIDKTSQSGEVNEESRSRRQSLDRKAKDKQSHNSS